MEKLYSILPDAHLVDERLQGFDIFQKPSSNIDYYGVKGSNVFIQFKNGATYIYENVPVETIEEMHKSESIGSFVYKNLAKKFEFKKFETKLVRPKPQEQ